MRKVGRLHIAYRPTSTTRFFGMHVFAQVSCLSFTKIGNEAYRVILTMEKNICSFDLNNVWLCHAHFSRLICASCKSTFPSMVL